MIALALFLACGWALSIRSTLIWRRQAQANLNLFDRAIAGWAKSNRDLSDACRSAVLARPDRRPN